MKNMLPIAIFITASCAFAQGHDNTESARVTGSAIINPARGKSRPNGSPYVQEAFSRSKVTKINIEAFMRYNIASDEFEFITPKNDTLVLDKTEDFSNIRVSAGNREYRLMPYTDTRGKLFYGYLILTYEKNGVQLFKKENIFFTEEKVARTTLETSMPARYSKGPDMWFIKYRDQGAASFPDGKKALLKMFADKKQIVESFLKENKPDFDDKAGKIMIIDFLAAL